MQYADLKIPQRLNPQPFPFHLLCGSDTTFAHRILLAFAGMPRVPVLRSSTTAEGGEARGGMATGDCGVADRAKTGGFGGVPLALPQMPRVGAWAASHLSNET